MLQKILLSGLAWLSVAASPAKLSTRQPGGRVVHAGDPVVVDPHGASLRLSFMNDGSMIGGYDTHIDGQIKLKTTHSSDGGATWQTIGEVFSGDEAHHDIGNCMPLQLPNGRVLYAFRNHDRTGNDLHYTWFRISLSYSDDGGKSFKYLSTVDERAPNGANGLWEPYLRFARDGTLQCYYSSENNGDDQDNLMKYSRDGGQTWSGPITVSGGNTRFSRDGMVGVAPIDNNGNLIAVFENTEEARFTVDYVISHNDGYSWGERGRLYTPRSNATAGAPQVYNVWGTLVASFMTDEDFNSGTGYDGAQAKVITSTDGAKTWSAATVVGEARAHWPGLFNRDPNHFLAAYNKDGLGLVTQLYELDW